MLRYSSLKIFCTDERKKRNFYHNKNYVLTNFTTPENSQKCSKLHQRFQIFSGSDTPGTPLHDVTHEWYMNNGLT